MKIVVLSFASCVLILSNYYHVTDGQDFTDPELFYKHTTFDKLNRGGYNITDCLANLLNCWEIIKPDVICSYDKYRTTICDVLKESCDDYEGLIDDHFGARVTLFETACQSDGWASFTK